MHCLILCPAFFGRKIAPPPTPRQKLFTKFPPPGSTFFQNPHLCPGVCGAKNWTAHKGLFEQFYEENDSPLANEQCLEEERSPWWVGGIFPMGEVWGIEMIFVLGALPTKTGGRSERMDLYPAIFWNISTTRSTPPRKTPSQGRFRRKVWPDGGDLVKKVLLHL